MLSKTGSFFVFISLFSATTLAQPKVYKYFPQCDYELLDTVRFSQKVEQEKGILTEARMQDTSARIIKKLLNKAKDLNADGILLVDRRIEGRDKESWTKNRDKHTIVRLTAEIINQCQPDPSIAKKATPFDESGRPQKQLQLGSIGGWQQEIILTLPQNEKRHTPPLANANVSFENGIYGVTLGMTYKDVIAKFGTPTFVMQPSNETALIAYGRKHWLSFVAGNLTKVSSRSPWFTKEFTNLLAFDERFEEAKWQVNGLIGNGDSFKQAQKILPNAKPSKSVLILTSGDNQITLFSDSYYGKSEEYANQVITGFSLQSQHHQTLPVPRTDSAPEVLTAITDYLEDSDRNQLTLEMLPATPIAKGWLDSKSNLYLYGHQLVLQEKGNSLNKLTFVENVYEGGSNSLRWQFNGVKQGQSFDEVIEILGDDAFGFDDLIEFSGDAFSQQLYFYEDNNQMRLFSSEITIY
ncbi:hypothetical protein [Aliiglaciecola sp. M165]|uniref:hypothetical protein n=1 Tax=Aliiglaciecola sp. M165 TaxID=2593649 RepID=UPI0011804197|nr:hypothetical protein [Aliiglaciecola sp. M165]TRY32855.1 hypothetical protein FM019_02385 [Aliiglaciecola sp. M165]